MVLLNNHQTLVKILQSVQGQGSVVLVGGQCLIVWAIHYENRGHKNLQIATEDVDLIGTKETVKELEKLLNTRALIPSMDHMTPELGVLRVPTISGNLTIDILGSIAGLNAAEIQQYSATLELGDLKVKVLNPVGMLKSRIANITVLKRTDQHSVAQLKSTIIIVNLFISSLLDQGYRFARKEISDVLYFAGHRDGIYLYKAHDLDLLSAVPQNHPNLPKEFKNRHLASILTKIEKKRATKV